MFFFFTEQEVRSSAQRSKLAMESYPEKISNIIKNQENKSKFDVFLSNSIRDEELVIGVENIFKGMGKTVYIDWVFDKHLSRDSVTKETAETLRHRMKQSSKLLYLATDNASSSKWMPWELGYFDGLKSGNVAILPLVDSVDSSFQGQEYLGLYPVLDKDSLEKFLD
jgi:hypothetical protein